MCVCVCGGGAEAGPGNVGSLNIEKDLVNQAKRLGLFFFFFFFNFYLFIYLFIYFWLCWVFGSCEGFL